MAKFTPTAFLLLIYATGNVTGSVTLVNEVYRGITIALNSDLSADRCENLINNLKTKFQEASSVLKESTRLRFGKIVVIIPKLWKNCRSHYISNISGHITWDQADFRVGSTHPIFGNQPWTDQFKSCGLPGNFIYLPVDFINTNSSSGNILVHEWAKYRWGVFEEYGISGDPIFPSHVPFGNNRNQPNLCTNRNTKGFESCEVDESCRYKYHNEQNNFISSSIMAVPEISSAKTFCDDRHHKSKFPNKHNLLCDGKSTLEIISKHSDFKGMRSRDDDEEVLELKLVYENTENVLVMAVENTASTSDATNRITFIKESISQFIKYELTDSYKVGFFEFAEIPQNIIQLTTLDAAGKNFLVEKVMSTKISKELNTNILKAIEVSSEVIDEGVGVIMLITSCPDRIDNFQLEQMISVAKNNQVWIILYPYGVCPQAKMLSELTDRTNGQIIYIKDEILPAQHPYVSPTIRMKLSQSYRSLLQSKSHFHFQQIHKEKCKESEVWCKRDIPIDDKFDDLHYLYFYHDYKEHVFASSEVAVSGHGSCDLIKMSHMAKGTKIFQCNIRKGSRISISVERDRPSDILIFELVGTPSRSQSDYNINIWSSNSLQNLTYSQYGVPAFYAELTYERRRIINANVTLRIEADNISTDYYTYANLNDQGVGADITGNDGIYSAYLLPTPLDRTILLSVFANDKDRNAMIWPEKFDLKNEEKIICCGSKVPVGRNDLHKETFTASLCNVPVMNHISSSYIRIAPSQIRDLIATQVGDEINLTFTSPGKNLDHGTAKFYIMTVYENNMQMELYTEKINNPKEAGSSEIIIVDIKNCSSSYGFTVAASDDKLTRAKESNVAIIYPDCNPPKSKGKMSTGMIVGIVIGIILCMLLLTLLFYWYRRRKIQINQEEQKIARELNGRLLEEGGELIQIETFSASSPIRSIEDLTAHCDSSIKVEESLYMQMPLTDSPTKSKSMDNLEVNELVKQSINKRKQSQDLPIIPKGDLTTQRASTSSSPNIIGIPLLLDEAIEYKKKKIEKKNKNTDINVLQIQYPYSVSSSSDGTEI